MIDQLALDLSTPGEEPLALFSPCRTWRYWLRRRLARVGSRVLFVMLNPSTADERRNDKTIDMCEHFARREGGADLRVVNLGSFCATDPDDFRGAEAAGKDPIGPATDQHIREQAERADLIVAAWGASGKLRTAPGVLRDRDQAVLALLRSRRDVYCLGRTQTGEPRHPSRLAHATPLELFAARSIPGGP